MFKRLFWISIGVGIGAVAVTKAQAYVEPARLNLIPNTRIRSADLIPVTYVRTTITNSFERHQAFQQKRSLISYAHF